jgi:hypothetical protein
MDAKGGGRDPMGDRWSRGIDGLARLLLLLAAAVILLTTPVTAGFGLRAFTCDFSLSPALWFSALVNYDHLIAYSILFVIAWLAFRRQPLWLPIALALAISIGVELEQSLFREGHCRLRDLLPNVIAVGIGLAVVFSARAVYDALRRRRA